MTCDQKQTIHDNAKNEVRQVKEALELVRGSYEAQGQELGLLNRERDRIISALNRQNSVVKFVEDYAAMLKAKNKTLRNQLKSQKFELDAQPVLVEEIPPTSWLCPEFPFTRRLGS